ncbi:TPA: helix-turn-helix transcriptional regulator [Pseudomonas aeruginosa]|nr:helix-turn-helix transcriptional regulator [Pseudomonas aeruginosa]MBG5723785.1 helix-turn-helix transcriptional regulator [Pseudomonas aeruginosa]HCG1164191.1 helix-turn-helix transcriptional regulator [Pseudomonas aeruginosa]HEJ3657971.1 helix-turn-helix transcriptional regulator [Pseudomonas aeruginosa]HEJ4932917.1 helix-turn-helix transcriptional regulator [Pseudomonas aeruginosa]
MIDITTIRRANALTLAEKEGGTVAFAARIDREPTQVSRLIGSNPTKNIGNRLARHIEEKFNMPRGWLDIQHTPEQQLRVAEPTAEYHSGGNLEPLSPWSDGDPLAPDEVEIPYFDEVEVAAGGGRVPDLELAKRKIRFPKATLREAAVDKSTSVCVNVTGNSMEPLIADGAIIGVDLSVNTIVDGEIYALKHDDLLRVKFVYRLPGGGIRLRSYNRAEYPDEEYTRDQMRAGGISVIGWVFWWSVMRRRRH